MSSALVRKWRATVMALTPARDGVSSTVIASGFSFSFSSSRTAARRAPLAVHSVPRSPRAGGIRLSRHATGCSKACAPTTSSCRSSSAESVSDGALPVIGGRKKSMRTSTAVGVARRDSWRHFRSRPEAAALGVEQSCRVSSGIRTALQSATRETSPRPAIDRRRKPPLPDHLRGLQQPPGGSSHKNGARSDRGPPRDRVGRRRSE